MKRLLMVLSLAIPANCQAAPSERDFAEDMLIRLKKTSPDAEMRIEEGEPLVIHIGQSGDPDEAYVNLHRIYGFCQNASEADCTGVKDEFVRKITTSPPEPRVESLMVMVRDKNYVDYLTEHLSEPGKEPLLRRIGEDLFAILAFDAPETIAVANSETLETLDLTREAAWSLAEQRARNSLPRLPNGQQVCRSAVAFQNFENLGSLLADLQGWSQVSKEAGPDMIVTVVSDNLVLVGCMPDGTGLDEFKRTVAEDCAAQERCISPHIYRFRKGSWRIAD
jgi:hypothetical protein